MTTSGPVTDKKTGDDTLERMRTPEKTLTITSRVRKKVGLLRNSMSLAGGLSKS